MANSTAYNITVSIGEKGTAMEEAVSSTAYNITVSIRFIINLFIPKN